MGLLDNAQFGMVLPSNFGPVDRPMSLKPRLIVFFVLCISVSTQSNADTVTKGLEQTARDVGNGVVGLLNAFGSGKLKPDNIELLSDSKVALSFNGQRFNNPCGIEVFWGDGSSEKFRVEKDAYKTGFTLEHQYDTPQDYQIEINGKVIFRGLKTVVNCPGNYEGTIALANQAPASSPQPPQDQIIQALSAQSDETVANAEKIKALEAEVAKRQAERIAELEAQLEAQANDEKIKRLEKELAEKQAKRIAELEIELAAADQSKSLSSLNKINVAIEAAPEVKNSEKEKKLADTAGESLSPKLQNNETSTGEADPGASLNQSGKSSSTAVAIPEIKGKKVQELSHKDWTHLLYCDGKTFGKDHYTSVWKKNGRVVRTKKYKSSGRCDRKNLPDLVMTNIVDSPVTFPESEVGEHCNQQLKNSWFDPIRSKIPNLEFDSFIKPSFDLLSSKALASEAEEEPLADFNEYFGQCYLTSIHSQIKNANIDGNDRKRVADYAKYVANAHASGVASLVRGEITFGAMAEIVSGEYQDAKSRFNNQSAMASAARQAAYQNRLRAAKERNAALQKSTQDALNKGLGGVSKALRPQGSSNNSTFKSNRRRECALQGKLYMNGSCR